MKTLLDTCVLIYALERKDALRDWARGLIAKAVAGEGAVANTVALAEVGVGAEDPGTVTADVASWGVQLADVPVSAAAPAARAFRAYLENRPAEAPSRRMPLPDFLIGAHALVTGYRVATNDPDRFKTYFPTVPLDQPLKD